MALSDSATLVSPTGSDSFFSLTRPVACWCFFVKMGPWRSSSDIHIYTRLTGGLHTIERVLCFEDVVCLEEDCHHRGNLAGAAWLEST